MASSPTAFWVCVLASLATLQTHVTAQNALGSNFASLAKGLQDLVAQNPVAVAGPINLAATQAALANAMDLGPDIRALLGELSVGSAVTALGVITALDQNRMQVQKLTQDILDANLNIRQAITADAGAAGLNLLFNPIASIAYTTTLIQRAASERLPIISEGVAALTGLLTAPDVGLQSLINGASNLAALTLSAPSNILAAVVKSSSNGFAQLQNAFTGLTSAFNSFPSIQRGMDLYATNIGTLQSTLQGMSTILSGWSGFVAPALNNVVGIARGLASAPANVVGNFWASVGGGLFP